MYGTQKGVLRLYINISNFRPKAKNAYKLSLEAISADNEGKERTRNQKWRTIYGNRFPN